MNMLRICLTSVVNVMSAHFIGKSFYLRYFCQHRIGMTTSSFAADKIFATDPFQSLDGLTIQETLARRFIESTWKKIDWLIRPIVSYSYIQMLIQFNIYNYKQI